ncbi:gluconeogenesis factor YvcK family protein [Petroclostridium sp. X23]|uniref:gluconeogenesis factor YvcK family protein n=1 Tax=Petroclostridium sp. X23 TaxID=3045146 RepID=UPI0024AD67E4|nr:gluconeogenesis factor YvcK family protein [Petroclostridium sp. X23]WHH60474.1 YvcK family protein [Petroclostridium sp. X23]
MGGPYIKEKIVYWMENVKSILKNSKFKIIIDEDGMGNLVYERSIAFRGPKIVAIGGGTGLSTMLRGLKKYTSNITAVVTVADDGGGSGVLRQDLGMLPPGDIRNCILALADTEPIMQRLLQYRFTDGALKGQSFGNLFLAAMNGISNNFEEAVKKMSDVLAVTGRVLPVTSRDIKLCAVLENGIEVCGESKIPEAKKEYGCRISKVYITPDDVEALDDVIEAINEADAVMIGPGSLYTSIMPNLIVKGIAEAIRNSKALKLYVCNIMTQPGETEGYDAYEHVNTIYEHIGEGIIDYCIVNKQTIPDYLLGKYADDGAQAVYADTDKFKEKNIRLIEKDILQVCNGYIRHDTDELARTIVTMVLNEVLAKDKKRIIDYYYVKDRLKQHR